MGKIPGIGRITIDMCATRGVHTNEFNLPHSCELVVFGGVHTLFATQFALVCTCLNGLCNINK